MSVIYADKCSPRYEHDCGPEYGCHFVGQVDDDDVWFHDYDYNGESRYTCVIMRHSSDGPDYGTWNSSFAYPEIPEKYQQAIALVVQHRAIAG